MFPEELIKLTDITILTNTSPTVISVLGEDFRDVGSVRVNGIDAPTYYVANVNQLYVTIPTGISSVEVTSVEVISKQFNITRQSLLRFQIGRVPNKTSGILRLVQKFVKVLFTTPGSDIFNPKLGGGALLLLGRNSSNQEVGNLVSRFVVAVDSTTRQLVTIQGRQPQLPPDEKLLSADVSAVAFSQQDSTLTASVNVLSQTGSSALANMVL